ncbi:cyclic GMP-AMP synthase-like receptor 2 [Mytilus edulis]|uniref:cyclic GMP-AMP synthase-like receptor 2 n=1 Tax=Mytilus edulis TaxID=6550 RepID=UPI0039F03AA2
MSKSSIDSSLQIYQYVCNIIGSEEVVKTRRKVFWALDNITQYPDSVVISSGSKAEGLDLEGSDYDQMFVSKYFRIYENIHEVSSSTNQLTVIMDISNTKPGFTKLKLYNISHRCIPHISLWGEIIAGEQFMSSKLFREYCLPDHMIIHGPCRSTPDETYDSAHCFRCKEWIQPACHWIVRSRLSWPDPKLVTAIVQNGVLFVPIGCKGSLDEDLEWRISFSIAEKQLIVSFSHTQLLCYALIKIILKDIIKKKHGDLICSYFIKTIMFWLCEESKPSQWHSQNMIPCFKSCMRRLIYCVEYKICLHYFIPGNNFFEGRFTDSQHKSLLDTLHEIYNSLLTNVFYTDTFRKFRSEQGASLIPCLAASELSCLTYPKILMIPLNYNNIKQIVTSLFNINDAEMSSYMMSLISNNSLLLSSLNYEGGNKSLYKQYQTSLNCYKVGMYNDVTSAWSLLASLFYKYKRFQECIEILNYTLSKCAPGKIMLCFDNSLLEQTDFQKVKDALGFILACKHLIINSVSFSEPYYLLPEELTPLIQHDVYDNTCSIPPVVYLNILSFLCLHHLDDQRGKLIVLRELELTIREEYFIFPIETNFQIANKCLEIAKSML